jgi:autotransporter-associated beta strand protein
MSLTQLPLRAAQRDARRSSKLKRPRFHPAIEALEERSLLSTAIWTGGGANNAWTNPANWAANVAPSPGDDLLFPAGAARLAPTNDFPAGTQFRSISFSGPGFTISGNALTLDAGISSTPPTGTNTISAPLTLASPQTFRATYTQTTLTISGAINTNGQALTVDGSGGANLGGIVSGAGGIVKAGPGTLSLSGANTYGGVTEVHAGILAITGFGTPLGSAAAGTTVHAGATLQTSGIVTSAEPLVIEGTGVGGGVFGSTSGALAVATGFATWTGGISLADDAVIGTAFTGNMTINTAPVSLNGHTLAVNSAGSVTVNTPITDGVGGSGNLAVNPAVLGGTVTLTASNTYTGSTYVKAGILNLSGASGGLTSTDIQLDGNGSVSVSSFPAPAGVLQLDNAAALNTDRLPDAATLTLTGGALSLLGRNAAVATTETIGTMHLARGQSHVRSTQSTIAGATSLLTIGSLVRDPGTTVNFSNASGPNLGTTTNRILFTSAPATVGNSGGILPYATITPPPLVAPAPDFATYDAALGIKQFTGYVTSLAAAGPGDTVLLQNVSTTLAASQTINALLIRNTTPGNTLTINPGVTLTLSNGLLTAGTGAATIQSGAGSGAPGTLSFDGNEGLITRFTQTNLSAVIAGSGGLVLGGLGSVGNGLLLNPPAPGNSYTGGTTINAGTVTIGNNNNVFGGAAGGTIDFYGGALQVANVIGLQPLTLPNALVLDNANAGFQPLALLNLIFAGPITVSGKATVHLAGNTTVTFAGQVSGAGHLVVAASGLFAGGGTLNLNNAANGYTGGTTLVGQGIFLPTLTLASAGALASGPLTIASGTLQTTAPGIAIANPVSFVPAPALNTTTTFAGVNPFSLAGPIDLLGAVTVTNSVAVTLVGDISGPGSYTKAGTAVLSLTGNSARTGATMVNGGTLLVNGAHPSSPVGVLSGTLGGNGTAGAIAVASGQAVNPGDPATVTGILAAAAADFGNGGQFRVQVTGFPTAGTQYDRLDLGSGVATLGGSSRLVVDLLGVTGPGRADGVLLYGSRSGNVPMFTFVDVVNNPNNFTVLLEYKPTALNLLIVDGPNDAPVNTVPGPQTTVEDTPLVFSTAAGNAISIADPDAGIYPVEVTLSASNGTLTLSGTSGLTFSTGDGTDDSAMVFTGSIADINAALEGLTFTPQLDYSGPAGLMITTNDQGNLGTGGPASATDSVSITVTNPTPTVVNLQVAPNPVNENGTVTLSGDIVNPAPLDTHELLIDWGDGSTPTTVVLGLGVRSFEATHQYLDDAGPGAATTYSITVTVSDDDSLSSSASTSATVNNVAPGVGAISPSSGVRGQSLSFAAAFTDAGTLDTHSATWDWGDGTSSAGTINESGGAGTTTASHVFTASGVYTVTVTVTDNDGGATTVSTQVTIVAAQLQPDSADPTKTALVVGGTTGSDLILLTRHQGNVRVSINGSSQGLFAPTGRIIVYGQAGNDAILLAGSIPQDAWIYGGAGNDLLMGGAGNNVLLGEEGDDALFGTSGRNLMIGGVGSDLLFGRPGDDILIGGATAFDANEAALLAIMAEWTSAADYQTRVDHLRGTTPGGLNGDVVLDATTVFDDLAVDVLHGSAGLDWFFAGLGDLIVDLQANEEQN